MCLAMKNTLIFLAFLMATVDVWFCPWRCKLISAGVFCKMFCFPQPQSHFSSYRPLYKFYFNPLHHWKILCLHSKGIYISGKTNLSLLTCLWVLIQLELQFSLLGEGYVKEFAHIDKIQNCFSKLIFSATANHFLILKEKLTCDLKYLFLCS